MSAASVSTRRGLDKVSRRRALVVSVMTAASALFVFTTTYSARLVAVNPTQAFFLVGLGVVGAISALLSLRIGVIVVGVAAIALGIIGLVGQGHGTGIITGGNATASVLVGLGILFLAVAASSTSTAETRTVDSSRAE